MPAGTVAFDVNASVEEVWSFLSDMQQVGRCVPGVENVEVLDAMHARWTLTVNIGPLSQTIKVLTETLEQIPLRRGRFRAEAVNLDMIRTTELTPAGKGPSTVYTRAVNAKGPV